MIILFLLRFEQFDAMISTQRAGLGEISNREHFRIVVFFLTAHKVSKVIFAFAIVSTLFTFLFSPSIGLCPAVRVPSAAAPEGGAGRTGGNVLHRPEQHAAVLRVFALPDK